MKIVVAPDKFKGSLTAIEAAAAIEAGIRRIYPNVEVDLVPMADGGEGTVDTLTLAMKGSLQSTVVTGPLGEPVKAAWGVIESQSAGRSAVIEMSAASGSNLLVGVKNASAATTYGTGELIKAALDRGCRRIILGIGGSATTDGGSGAAEALGVRFIDSQGRRLKRGGGALGGLARIDTSEIDERLTGTEVLVACDVDNPLYGTHGAAHVYGPQKGATGTEIARLDKGLRRLSAAIKNDLGLDISEVPGGGAAGGLGAGLMAFAGAKLAPGVELISEAVGLRDRIAGAVLVITGEGQIDRQTKRGKVPAGVARLAKELGVPVVAIAGTIGPGAEEVYASGLAAIEPICTRPMTFKEATDQAASLVESAAERLLQVMQAGRLLGQKQ